MIRNLDTLIGCTLSASDGDIGKVREMYFDDEHWAVRYFVVTTGSWLSGREVLVSPRSLGDVQDQSGAITVHLTKSEIANAPSIDSDKPVSRQYEDRYHRHFGLSPYWAIPGGGAGPWTPVATGALHSQTLFEEGGPPNEVASSGLPSDITDEGPKANSHLRSSNEVRGYTIHAQDGELGSVTHFLIDDSDWRICYLVIATRNWLPGKHVLVAPKWVEVVSFREGQVFVNLPRSTIEAAPPFDLRSGVDRTYEKSLHDHYKLKAYWDAVKSAS